MTLEVRGRTAANRRVAAELFSTLDDRQLATASLCAGWTCRDVLGHLVMCIDLSVPRFLLQVARDRGRADVTSARLAHDYAARPVSALVGILQGRSGDAVSQPGVGPWGPFADSCIHLRDVAIPLALPTSPPLDDWRQVLDFLTTPRARAGGFLPRGRLDGLHLSASDQPWTSGSGAAVTGPSEALVMALTGRPALLDQLTGDGVSMLRRRLPEVGPP